MLLTELSFSDEQTLEIISSESIDDLLSGAGAKQLKPGFWFFPSTATSAISNIMKLLAKRGIFTYLEK